MAFLEKSFSYLKKTTTLENTNKSFDKHDFSFRSLSLLTLLLENVGLHKLFFDVLCIRSCGILVYCRIWAAHLIFTTLSYTDVRAELPGAILHLFGFFIFYQSSQYPVPPQIVSTASGRQWAWAPCGRSSDSRRSRGVAGLISPSACSALHLCNLIHATHQSLADPHPALVTPPYSQEEHGCLVSDVTWHQGIVPANESKTNGFTGRRRKLGRATQNKP